jgi:hypothetical protein
MDFDDYQRVGRQTDTIPLEGNEKLHFLLLGLTDELGQIAGLVKKFMRHDIAVQAKRNDVISRLGDALWYMARIADELGTGLSAIAEENLHFLERRWLPNPDSLFHSRREYLSDKAESLPDRLEFLLERREEDGIPKMRLSLDGKNVGDTVDDNEYVENYYRFHDIIHISCMACLRWSPFFRKFLNLKRRHDTDTDRVEDGARARDIEEALSIVIFQYFENNDFLKGATSVDTSFLRSLRAFSGLREISWVTEREWEDMMMKAAAAIRQIISAKEGFVVADMKAGTVTFRPIA